MRPRSAENRPMTSRRSVAPVPTSWTEGPLSPAITGVQMPGRTGAKANHSTARRWSRTLPAEMRPTCPSGGGVDRGELCEERRDRRWAGAVDVGEAVRQLGESPDLELAGGFGVVGQPKSAA